MSTTAEAPPATDRIALLRTQIMARKGSFAPAHDPFIPDAALIAASAPERSRIQQRAAFLVELVARCPTSFPDGWTIAGEHLPHGSGIMRGLADARRHLADLGIADPVAGERLVRDWHAGSGNARAASVGIAGDRTGLGRWGDDRSDTSFWAMGWIENHSIRDYGLLLRRGFAGLRDDIARRLAGDRLDDPGFPQRENAWRAFLAICDAGIRLGRRWAEAARRQADACDDPGERDRLLAMAAACDRVPVHGARTLREAVQSLWLGHVLACGEDGINANSLGRLDQMLEPWYQADLAAGRIDRESAVELMAELACKLYLDYDVQAITLGGMDAEGRDATCAMTWIILDATERVGFVRDLAVRLHGGSPPALVRRCAGLVARGGGIPFLFNDDCFVPALAGLGIPARDARDYAPIGCVELTIPGKANPHAVSGWFNLAKCVELALHGGLDPASGLRIGPDTGDLAAHATFDSLLAAVETQVGHHAERLVYHCNRGELRQRDLGPLPSWSLLTDACIERGRDITDGGARHLYHSICLLGVPDAADALQAVREAVYQRQEVAAGELLSALRTGWEGHEPLRQRLLGRCAKYGNDREEVDLLAAGLADRFIDRMDRARSPLGGRYAVHLFSFLCNLQFGRTVGALPDGRRPGEPLAYSLSAHQGRDQAGVTAFLGSLARLPHRRAAGGSAAIVEIDPALVAGEAGIDRLAGLITTAFAMGVGQLQWNVVTGERLRQAQEDPERHGGLAVRVAGFSQQFRLLDRPLQDHIIARTKHRS